MQHGNCGNMGCACVPSLGKVAWLDSYPHETAPACRSLGHNQLSGPLPVDLPLSLPSLDTVDLPGNRLTGPLPPTWVGQGDGWPLLRFL